MSVAIWISTEYLKTTTHISTDIDPEKIQNSVRSVQDVYVQPELGTVLYNKCSSDIAASSLAGNYATLVNTWVAPYLAWQTVADALPFWGVRIGNGGITRKSPEGATALDSSEVNSLAQKARQKAEFYKQRLIDYLCNHNELFPEYSTNTEEDITPRHSNHSSTIWLG